MPATTTATRTATINGLLYTTTWATGLITPRQASYITDLGDQYVRYGGTSAVRPSIDGCALFVILEIERRSIVSPTMSLTEVEAIARRCISEYINNAITVRDRAHTVHVRNQAAGDRLRTADDAAVRSLAAPAADVGWPPEGFYAIDNPFGGTQPVLFYAVQRHPRSGRSVVRQVIGGRLADRTFGNTTARIINAIHAQGVLTSARRYAAEIGRCYVCNTRLTDHESRRLGIGPDCRGGRSRRGMAFATSLGSDRARAAGMGEAYSAATLNATPTTPAATNSAFVPPTEGTCACGEAAIGYVMRVDDNPTVPMCDECAIDDGERLIPFARNPRKTA